MAESLFFQVEFCDGCSPVYKRIDLGSLFNGQPDTVEFNIDEAPGPPLVHRIVGSVSGCASDSM